MANELLYPYAYDEELQDYLAPDDPRIRQHHAYKVGTRSVYLRRISGKRDHFWDPSASAGGAGGGGPETAAHIYAKKFYKQWMRFYAIVSSQSLLVRFATCVLEQRLDERTPDLTATISECWPPFFAIGSRILIEIHARNAIHQNQGRREALIRIGVPCLEVDLPDTAVDWKFKANENPWRQRQRFEAYMDTVLSDPTHVRWIMPDPAPVFQSLDRTIALIEAL